MVENYHNGDVFEVRNPLFLGDTFIFDTKRRYISVNYCNKIESIGTDIEERFRYTFGTFDNILKCKLCKIATKRHKRMLKMIDDEYFAKIDNNSKLFRKLQEALSINKNG